MSLPNYQMWIFIRVKANQRRGVVRSYTAKFMESLLGSDFNEIETIKFSVNILPHCDSMVAWQLKNTRLITKSAILYGELQLSFFRNDKLRGSFGNYWDNCKTGPMLSKHATNNYKLIMNFTCCIPWLYRWRLLFHIYLGYCRVNR